MSKTVNIQIRAREWLRNFWDELYDRSKFHSKGELFESVIQLYKKAMDSGVVDDRDELEEQITFLSTQLDEWKVKCETKDQEIANMEHQLQEQFQEPDHIQELLDELNETKQKLNSLQGELTETREQTKNGNDEWQAHVKEVEATCDAQEQEIAELKLERDQLSREARENEEKAEEVEQDYRALIKRFDPLFQEVKGQTLLHHGEPLIIETHEDLIRYVADHAKPKQNNQ